MVLSAGSSFKKVPQFEASEGRQHPGISVFVRSPDGAVKHFCSPFAYMKEKEYRGLDLLWRVWNPMDLTPEGRGN